MIVVDASALVEWLTDASGRSAAVAAELGRDPEWAVPQHAVIETMNALRGLKLGGRLDGADFVRCVAALEEAEFDEWPTRPLLAGMVRLAPNVNAYDAAYLVLAVELGAPLVTCDAKLAGAASGARVIVVR